MKKPMYQPLPFRNQQQGQGGKSALSPAAMSLLAGLAVAALVSGQMPVQASALISEQASAQAPALADLTRPENERSATGTPFIEEITIVGQRDNQRQITGAAQYIGPEQLTQQAYSDIQRVLRQAPGISLQVEDGYGLRPNISIRGVATERSGRITLLEDNILIAPAPYSAPSAYYFPTAGRMHAVEVLKGPAAISQGPYSIGGALNMVSTPIPADPTGWLRVEAGEDSTYRLHATYGRTKRTASNGSFGYLLETHQWQSDGFQRIDRSDSKTGLDVEDYTLKLAYGNTRHHLELKLQHTEQDSQQSYLGLTDADLKVDAFRRYGLSALDGIDTQHEQQILRYRLAISDAATFTATAYNNEHERDWFKTEGMDLDGSAEAFSHTSWTNVVNAINRGESLQGMSPANLQAILDGVMDTPIGSIQVRSNSREYFSRGVQFRLDWRIKTGDVTQDMEVAVRFHEDEEDRLQRNSSYRQQGGALVLDDTGMPGNAGNRVQQAEAMAVHIIDRIEFGRWALTPGLRYEDIDQRRTRWETRNGRTANPASRDASNIRDTRSNGTQVWLPGLGTTFVMSETASLIAGVHKGFTAPSNAPGVDEEKAINYELGFRFAGGATSAEAIYFLSDYDNLLGECTASSGSDCAIGDAFNGDAARVQGIEAMLSTDLAASRPFSLPLTLNYTWIDGEFSTDIADTDFFGDVSKGDPIPYIPEHQFNLSLGWLKGKWAAYINASYTDGVCTRASCGAFEKTDGSLTLDLAAHYALTGSIDIYGKVENATDEEDITGRQPYGARPNKVRTAALGVRMEF